MRPSTQSGMSADLCWAYIQIGAVQKGMDLYRATRIPNQEIPAPTAWTPTAVAYALCEIATGQLDLAASTLGARRLSNTIMGLCAETGPMQAGPGS